MGGWRGGLVRCRRRHVAIAALAGILLAPAVAATTSASGAPTVELRIAANTDRQQVIDDYLEQVVPAVRTPFSWSGSVAACDPGAPASAVQQATLTVVNYARDLVGLDPVTFDPTLSGRAQKAALIMNAANQLSHAPPSSWPCWTADGAQGAASSNLALGTTGPEAILAYLDDYGASNTRVGHRRWVLYPPTTVMGSGSTPGANALWVISPTGPGQATPDVVAWPAAGYFPAQLEPDGRWSASFSDPAIDLSQADVTVTGPSGPVAITTYPVQSGPGSNTVVWEAPGAGASTHGPDVTYSVRIDGLSRNGAAVAPVSYATTLVPVLGPPMTVLTPPTVEGLAGQFRVGTRLEALIGTYEGYEPWLLDHRYQWQRDGTDIPGATDWRYRPTAADFRHRLRVRVTALHPDHEPSPAFSAAHEIAAGPAPVARKRPVVTGTPKVGRKLRSSTGAWSRTPERYTFQWLRNNKVVRGATDRAYKVTKADRGKRLTCQVTAVVTGYRPGRSFSRAVTIRR